MRHSAMPQKCQSTLSKALAKPCKSLHSVHSQWMNILVDLLFGVVNSGKVGCEYRID